ncbi:head maturation protease [Aeromonas phage D3]|uniref:Virion structural protein n=1 Tax=Aeromonas phage D3 TaxID=2593327 RepID=A0A514TVH0_9CAUD|nr:head maturation protease [Aeromonas phage D3]QDJ96970.1 hypothetical protein D3_0240 [Aeromonas phage D3]
MSEISFGNIILANSGKQGILKPDATGRYLLNAGGFNIANASGINYPANQYIVSQMDKNSDLMRRVSQGYCKMEVEHPEPFVYVEENGVRYKKAMTSILEWINRLRSYDPDRICGLISEISFRPTDPNDLTKPIYNMIYCEPFGPRGPEFKESLNNPRHNTAVSIRTQVSPFRPGDNKKEVEYWVGYDWVGEPGMVHANKHMTAGCESLILNLNDNVQKFKVADVLDAMEEMFTDATANAEALERVGGMESLNAMREMHDRLKQNYRTGETVRMGASFADIF